MCRDENNTKTISQRIHSTLYFFKFFIFFLHDKCFLVVMILNCYVFQFSFKLVLNDDILAIIQLRLKVIFLSITLIMCMILLTYTCQFPLSLLFLLLIL